MNDKLKSYLEDILSEKIKTISSVSGGDISSAFKIETSSEKFFLKMNAKDFALDLFTKEAAGLNEIASTRTIAVPKIISVDKLVNTSFLIMEFIPSKSATPQNMQELGFQLAQLHKTTSKAFGLNTDNYIGSLAQSNREHKDWTDFYISERIQPQLNLAKSLGRLNQSEIPSENDMINSLNEFFTDIKPSLLHGDLWSGNYLISEDGQPYLIDPAVYYGHSEVDIAMSKLFGGFDNAFYESYFQEIPEHKFTSSRIEIYQLYYLLVHLNLFGNSYRPSVLEIMTKYF